MMSADPTALAELRLLGGRLVDLTLTLHDGQRGVTLETAMTIDADGRNACTLHLNSHAGTHRDAPTHFYGDDELVQGRPASEQTIESMSLTSCIGPARVVDLPGLSPREVLHVNRLGEVAENFVPGESLLLWTGWSAYVNEPATYRDGLPRIANDLAE